jgi:NAD-dependent DNA ligase
VADFTATAPSPAADKTEKTSQEESKDTTEGHRESEHLPVKLGGAFVKSGSTGLPLCSPLPEVTLPGRLFCFTGKFVTGTRNYVRGLVQARGSVVADSPTNKTNYLVIGEIGSNDWIHSTHGRKIEKAVQIRNEGKPIHIIAEGHWLRSVERVAEQPIAADGHP